MISMEVIGGSGLIKHAEEVLKSYSISNPVIEFIRHNENITFKVSDGIDNKVYLLRIHKSITEGLSGIQHSLEGLNSEMYMLQELTRDDIIHVQKPVANHMGDFVTEYNSSEFDSCFATLLEWIEGSIFSLEQDNMEQIAKTLGEKMADFHNYSRDSKLLNLHKPIYGVEKIDLAIEELKYGVINKVYSQHQYEIIVDVLGVVKGQIIELDARGQEWGLIHADVQLGNVIMSEETPCFIDFCLSGYGYYLFDLGSASTILKGESRTSFLQGYASKTTFSFEDIRYIEGQIFMDIFISYAMFIRDSNCNGWVIEHAARICDTVCKDFMDGKEVYCSL